MPTSIIYLNIYIISFFIISITSLAADYRYEACGPTSCGKGPNISFPFHIAGLQNSYCGYPGFTLNCSHGFPSLRLPETEYIVNDIFYATRSFRVYNSAVMNQNLSGCVPRIRNTSLPTAQFDFAENVTELRLFSGCKNSSSEDGGRDVCDAEERGGRVVALYGGDGGVGNALENCARNAVAPVEGGGGEVVEVLRRGFVLKWTASDCSKCESSGGRCGFNETTYLFRCFCRDSPRYRRCRRSKKDGSTLILAAALFGGGVFLLLCMSISFIVWRCKKRLKTAFDPSNSDVEHRSFYFGTHIFSYKELMDATKRLDPSNEIGDGGFGTVYYGKLRDGREVAVKRLHEHNYQRLEQFMNEIKILTCLRHKNLVSLYGCTSTKSKELLLVYEYVSNGTVADHLHGERAFSSPLTWPVRINIAIETASALAYLHKSEIIHRDVKTSNILLDNNFSVKIADFGISRVSDNDFTHVSTAPQGTPGYVDPSYFRSHRLTDKSDVYSFGVVLVELVSSKPAVDMSRENDEINLADLAVSRIERGLFDEVVDKSLGYESNFEVARMTTSVAELAFRCLQVEKDVRPSMDEVLNVLNEIRESHEFKFHARRENGDNCLYKNEDVATFVEIDDIEESGVRSTKSTNYVTVNFL